MRTSKALSLGASSVSWNHMAPTKWSWSPAATHEPSSKSIEVSSPSLSRTFNQPRPKERLTRSPSSEVSGSGAKPAVPLSSRQPTRKRTLSWSGSSLVMKNFQWISRMPLLSTEYDVGSTSTYCAGSFGSGKTSPYCQEITGQLAALPAVMSVSSALTIELAASPMTCLETTS